MDLAHLYETFGVELDSSPTPPSATPEKDDSLEDFKQAVEKEIKEANLVRRMELQEFLEAKLKELWTME